MTDPQPEGQPPPLTDYTVQMSPVGDNVHLVWDGVDETVGASVLFAETVQDEVIINAIRQACVILGTTDPTAASIVQDITQRGGVQTPSRRVWVQSVAWVEARGAYSVTYGYSVGDSSYGIEFRPEALGQLTNTADLLANDIGAFLRVAGHESLTPEAIKAVEQTTFQGYTV